MKSFSLTVLSHFFHETSCGKKLHIRVIKNNKTKHITGTVKLDSKTVNERLTITMEDKPTALYETMLMIQKLINIFDDNVKFKL
jgi:hypothetical protein